MVFVKRSSSRGRRDQADVIEQVYSPIAEELGLPACHLPARPSPSELVELGTRDQRDRLRYEVRASETSLVITLGDEARAVLHGIADDARGAPAKKLATGDDYGRPGTIRIGDHEARWLALTHPGNSSGRWKAARAAWARRINDWMSD